LSDQKGALAMRKTILWLGLSGLACLLLAARVASAAGTRPEPGQALLERAARQAKVVHHPIFLVFGASW
jgi:hypothetical protein